MGNIQSFILRTAAVNSFCENCKSLYHQHELGPSVVVEKSKKQAEQSQILVFMVKDAKRDKLRKNEPFI